MSIELLLQAQNSDGGWPYVKGSSWTEPTAFATLALLTGGELEAAGRGLRWLRGMQRPDGGWPPQWGVDHSSWVTAVVALLPPDLLGAQTHGRAIRWLMGIAGEESSIVYRLRQWMLGNPTPKSQASPGWPWLPGSAAWVGPTSLAILALDKQLAREPSPAIRSRVDEGRRFLMNRVCGEGGWNHGASETLGYDLRPYPETTGMALAAMRGVRSPMIEKALHAAARFLAECRSADALNWLRLGLAAHGRMPAGYCPSPRLPRRTVSDTALGLLASGAEKGGEIFWSRAS